MLDTDTKRRIDTARDILVGKVPDPKSQVEQITIALIYKFMDDMDAEAEELGGKRKFFTKEFARYGWAKLMHAGLGGHETLALYAEGITKMPQNPGIPPLFRDIFKNAYLPYRDPETLKAFLKIIDEFTYDHSERLGDAFEYLLSVIGSQGDAGQFRTPRHIIDFMVAVLDPKKNENVLDPACGTAGFLISAYKFILRNNTSGPKPSPQPSPRGRGSEHYRGGFDFAGLKQRARELREKQTDAEALLWDLLRDRQLADAKFRRQHQFGDYICDFYCHEAKLVVECDGDVHQTAERRQLDIKRDTYLKSQGLTVLRFQNDQILETPEPVLEAIGQYLLPPLPLSLPPSPTVLPPSPTGRGAGGEGSPGRPGDLLTPDEKGRLAKNFRGYDISPDMVRLSLVNLYLHGFTDPHISEYDTLTSEERWNEYADVILANPPFMSPKGGIKPHKRFSIQAKRSEVLFVDYMAEHLTPGGRAAIIVPEGIIFQSQTAYKQLRKLLVEDYLVAVVSLPAGVFQPYSGVKTSILILDKSRAKQAQNIAFFKIENDGFGLGAQRRAIEKNDLPDVLAGMKEYFNMDIQDVQDKKIRKSSESCESCPSMLDSLLRRGLALIVPKEKIAANGDYNLSGERYRVNSARIHAFPLVPLGQVCTINPAKREGLALAPDTLVSFIPMSDLGENQIAFLAKETKRIDELGTSYTYFADGDVLVAKVTPCFENGKAGVARGLTNGVGFGSSEFYVLRPTDRVLAEYIYFCVTSQTFRAPAIAQMTGTGGLQRVPKGYVEQFQIPLPPLEVQKEIVAEIEGYQKVINGARAVLDNYRPHIPIDPDWPMVEIGTICTIVRGSSPRPQGNPQLFGGPIPRLMVSDITRDGMYVTPQIDSLTELGATKSRPMKKGDVIITVSGNPGLPTILAIDACIHDGFVGLRNLTEEVLPEYLYFALLALHSQHGSLSVGAVFKNLTTDQIREFKIALPPLATQRAVVAEIEAEQALVAANRELITRFEKKIQATLARIWGEKSSGIG